MAGTPAPTPQTCAQDIDCPNATICFVAQRTTWVKEKYGPAGAFCGCSRARGFNGYPECSTPEPAYWSELAFHVLLFCILAWTAFLCVFDLARLRRIKQLSLVRPTVQTSALVLVATILHANALVFTRLCSLSDGARTVAVGFKLCRYTAALLVFTVLSVLASFLAQANVAVVWLGIAMRIEAFSRETNTILRRLVYIGEILYLGILLYAAGSLQLAVAIVTTIIFAVALMVGYVWGGLALANVLRESLVLAQAQPLRSTRQFERDSRSASFPDLPSAATAAGSGSARNPLSRDPSSLSNAMEMSLMRVRNVTLWMAALLLCQIVCLMSAAVFTVRTGGPAYEEDFWYRPSAIALDMTLFLMVAMNAVVALYIRSSISSSVLAAQAEWAARIPPAHQAPPAVTLARTLTLATGQLTAHIENPE